MMVGETTEFRRLTPDDASAFAQPMHAFLAGTWRGLYAAELGQCLNITADPIDPGAVSRQCARLAGSGNLAEVGEEAYCVALDAELNPSEPHIVGACVMTRTARDEVEINELDVALRLRGRRIGPALLDAALSTLIIRPDDMLSLKVLEQNVRGRAFWRALGFEETGAVFRNAEVFPNPENRHLLMRAAEATVHMAARKRSRQA